MSEQPTCPKCNDTGTIPCQRCINGVPEGDRYFEQGGPTMGCSACHDFRRMRCECERGKEIQFVAGGYNIVSGLFGSWDTEENRQKLAYAEPIWTAEYPSRPGYYWTRNRVWQSSPYVGPEEELCVVNVTSDLSFFDCGSELMYDKSCISSAEWWGPIEPPQ